MALREIDFLGVKMMTGSDAELAAELADKSVFHVVLRVADETSLPYPALAQRRFRTPCADCRQICWIDPKSLVVPTALVVCTRCILFRAVEAAE